MPEYLSPGVYVEEVSRRGEIAGVPTSVAGFVGPTRFGPFGAGPEALRSLTEFERTYSDGRQLNFTGAVLHNYMWHAARAFFAEGGERLYVSRVFSARGGGALPRAEPDDADPPRDPGGDFLDGHARTSVPVAGGPDSLRVRARFPGAAGNFRVRFTLRLGGNLLGAGAGSPKLRSLRERDVVFITRARGSAAGGFYLADSYLDRRDGRRTWRFLKPSLNTSGALRLSALAPGDRVRVLTLDVTITTEDGGGPIVRGGLALDPAHESAAALTSARELPVVVNAGAGVTNGLHVLGALLAADRSLIDRLADSRSGGEASFEVLLEGGNDGARPAARDYEGDDDGTSRTGLRAFEDVEDISVVATPGSTYGYEREYREEGQTVVNHLISHAERMRYRVAVVDSGDGQSVSQVRAMRARIDSSHAAFYYPWVRVADPVTRAEVALPPSGFVAGIYARNDRGRGVFKAPADEAVSLAVGLDAPLDRARQDVLNPEGINCIRHIEGRGFRIWGARTAGSDPEWKYVHIRRYLIYLEQSIDKGTQWAVFEPNEPSLWASVRREIENFLLSEWRNGGLLGDKPEKAFFVRCDATTMTQNDLDGGRLVCLVGVAMQRPAEFVIFRVGQWTCRERT